VDHYTAIMPGFFFEELNRALDEQSFGIKGFSVLEGDDAFGTASIETLEGDNLTIRLDSSGYQVRWLPYTQ
jgi:hypothetical protein